LDEIEAMLKAQPFALMELIIAAIAGKNLGTRR